MSKYLNYLLSSEFINDQNKVIIVVISPTECNSAQPKNCPFAVNNTNEPKIWQLHPTVMASSGVYVCFN
jgi:hypothetical protein